MARAKSTELVTTSGVRRAFLDYFSQRGHALVPGSPVLPLGDLTVPFVPAGMHQFRHVLLGDAPAPAPQVVNSQRCIRVGGKHCDLATVGTDGSHLTFFEMLGSWTFGASRYWKREVCADALNFLSGPLRVDASRVRVTYFGGDPNLGLKADEECYDVWRSLGVPEDRVLPCPAVDNMWEMGASGPCGPCTEIYVDGVEIWNLVFIQHCRSTDGFLSPLKLRSIDTGMGLERLIALLSGRNSVFDIDTFLPLLEVVSKRTRAAPYSGTFADDDVGRRDAAYRLLVDHARTIAVALADGVVPDRQYKLRRVIRRWLLVAERHFGVTDHKDAAVLLEELADHTIETLNAAHPSLTSGAPAMRHLLRYEITLFSKLREKESFKWSQAVAAEPRLAALADAGVPRDPLALAWRCVTALSSKGLRTLPGDEAYRICDTHGIGVDILEELAQLAGMQGVDSDGFRAEQNRVKNSSRLRTALGGKEISSKDVNLLPKNLPATDTTNVYSYSRLEDGKYCFPSVPSKVLALIQDGVLVEKAVPGGGSVGAVLNTTNLYRARGGQEADYGRVETSGGAHLEVQAPVDVERIVVHWGELSGAPLSVGDKVEVHVDADRRLATMRNHTAAHIFNKCLRERLIVATQKRAPVSHTRLEFALESYGKLFTIEEIKSVEEAVRTLVRASLPVKKEKITAWNWHQKPVTFIPDAAYPTLDLSVVEIGDESRELCGGTHVYNSADIGEVCVIKACARGKAELTAVTGCDATAAFNIGNELLRKCETLADEALVVAEAIDGKNSNCLIEMYWKCRTAIDDANNCRGSSYFSRAKSVQLLEDAVNTLEKQARIGTSLEVEEAASGHRFAAVLVRYAAIFDRVMLNKITRPLPDKALLLVAILRDGRIRARCCVPDNLVSSDFDAKLWLSSVASALGGQAVTPPGVDPKKVSVLEPVGSSKLTVENVQEVIEDAQRFAEDRLLQRASCL